MRGHGAGGLSPAREIAYVAVTCALLIGMQLALYALPGVECVTALLLCASFAFGARFGFLTGLAFSLLRCILFGFYPSVIILYCIYFPLFGLIFGLTGKLDGKKLPLFFKVAVNVALVALGCAAFCAAGFDLIKVSRIYKVTIEIFLWVLGGDFCAIFIAFNAVCIADRRSTSQGRLPLLFFVTTTAAICTVCFTLLDDVITPLVIGMTAGGALTYFYASFTAILPQTVCTVISVALLFYPLTSALIKLKK